MASSSNNTTSNNTTKALSTAHLPLIKSYIDKEIAKKTDGILTGFDDIKAVGLPKSDAINKLDIFDCGSGDIYSYDYTTGIDTIVNGPKNLTGPFVLVRTREEIVAGAYNGAYDTYAGKQLVKTFIFTTGKKSELLVDGDPLIFNNLSIYDPVSGKGYSATGVTTANWTENTLARATLSISKTGTFSLKELHVLNDLNIYSTTDATIISNISDLPTNETAANIASVVIRSTSIGEIKNSKIGYIAQELAVTRKDGTTVSYLRFLASPNYDGNFTASDWESKTLLSFKEVSALTMFNSLNKAVDGKIGGLNTRVDGIDARVTSLESSGSGAGSGSGSSSVTQAEINDIKDDITDIESRLASLGFKKGCMLCEGRHVGHIARLGNVCYMRFISDNIKTITHSLTSLSLYEGEFVEEKYHCTIRLYNSDVPAIIELVCHSNKQINNRVDFIECFNEPAKYDFTYAVRKFCTEPIYETTNPSQWATDVLNSKILEIDCNETNGTALWIKPYFIMKDTDQIIGGYGDTYEWIRIDEGDVGFGISGRYITGSSNSNNRFIVPGPNTTKYRYMAIYNGGNPNSYYIQYQLHSDEEGVLDIKMSCSASDASASDDSDEYYIHTFGPGDTYNQWMYIRNKSTSVGSISKDHATAVSRATEVIAVSDSMPGSEVTTVYAAPTDANKTKYNLYLCINGSWNKVGETDENSSTASDSFWYTSSTNIDIHIVPDNVAMANLQGTNQYTLCLKYDEVNDNYEVWKETSSDNLTPSWSKIGTATETLAKYSHAINNRYKITTASANPIAILPPPPKEKVLYVSYNNTTKKYDEKMWINGGFVTVGEGTLDLYNNASSITTIILSRYITTASGQMTMVPVVSDIYEI